MTAFGDSDLEEKVELPSRGSFAATGILMNIMTGMGAYMLTRGIMTPEDPNIWTAGVLYGSLATGAGLFGSLVNYRSARAFDRDEAAVRGYNDLVSED